MFPQKSLQNTANKGKPLQKPTFSAAGSLHSLRYSNAKPKIQFSDDPTIPLSFLLKKRNPLFCVKSRVCPQLLFSTNSKVGNEKKRLAKKNRCGLRIGNKSPAGTKKPTISVLRSSGFAAARFLIESWHLCILPPRFPFRRNKKPFFATGTVVVQA